MPVSLDNKSTNAGNGAGFSSSHTVAGLFRLMTFDIQIEGSVHASSVSFNGLLATLLDSISHASGECETWYLLAPPAGTFTWNVTLNGSANAVIGVRSWNGVHQVTPIIAHAKANGSTSPISASVASSVGGMVIDNVAVQNLASDVITPAAGQIQDWNIVQGAVTVGVIGGGSHKAATGGTDTMSWTTGVAGQWASIVTAIQARTKNLSASPSLSLAASSDRARVRDGELLERIRKLERREDLFPPRGF